jgi:hypothetical protein
MTSNRLQLAWLHWLAVPIGVLAVVFASPARADIINLVNGGQSNLAILDTVDSSNNSTQSASRSDQDLSQGSSTLLTNLNYADSQIAGSASLIAGYLISASSSNRS